MSSSDVVSTDDQLQLATAHDFAKRKEWLEAHASLEQMSPELRTAPCVVGHNALTSRLPAHVAYFYALCPLSLHALRSLSICGRPRSRIDCRR
jgi:hypothetical protein